MAYGVWLQYPAMSGIAFVRRVVTASLRSMTAAAEAQTMAASIQDEGDIAADFATIEAAVAAGVAGIVRPRVDAARAVARRRRVPRLHGRPAGGSASARAASTRAAFSTPGETISHPMPPRPVSASREPS